MVKALSIALLILPLSVFAADKNYGSVVVDEVTSIYDGDTFTVNIKSWPAVIGSRIKVRLKGIDTPEMKAECRAELQLARKAKQHTVEQLRRANRIELRNIERDKYFRLLADVKLDGQDLSDQLVRLNLARRYEGGKKVSWCN